MTKKETELLAGLIQELYDRANHRSPFAAWYSEQVEKMLAKHGVELGIRIAPCEEEMLRGMRKGSVAATVKAIISANVPTTGALGMKSNAIRQRFCERHLAGVLYKDISEELGISLRTASYWAEEMGLSKRTGAPRRQKWMPGKQPKIC